jgi:hypothetical protein
MTFSALDVRIPAALSAAVADQTLSVELSDGRSLSAPLAWFPRLLHATPEERSNWRLVGKGDGVHWDDLDEDISIESLLLGRPSRESQASLARWLQRRR